MTGHVRDPLRSVGDLAARLAAAGLVVGPDRLAVFVEAVGRLDAGSVRDVRSAGRATLCGDPVQLAVFDAVLASWLADARPIDLAANGAPADLPTPVEWDEDGESTSADDGSGDGRIDAGGPARVGGGGGASLQDVRARRPPIELEREAADEIAAFRDAFARGAGRRRPRPVAGRGSEISVAGSVRAMLAVGGEVAPPARLRQRIRPRRLVLLIDVSGSMRRYTERSLRFGYAAVDAWPGPVEVFTIGTRLTRITRSLASDDPARALAAVGAAVADWQGGTRLTAGLRRFLDVWGQPGVARGAHVALLSDCGVREDPARLEQQAQRCARISRRLLLAHPHADDPVLTTRPPRGVEAVRAHASGIVGCATTADLVYLAERLSGR
jgi:uncharacterized protein